MSTYELISQLGGPMLEALTRKGIVRATVLRDKELYEYYMEQCRSGEPRMQARTNTADEFHVSEELVSKILQKMK